MTGTDKAIQRRFDFRGRNRNLPWYPRKGTRENLAELYAELGFTNGVEVGTREGLHARILCEKNPDLRLVCVDPWMAYGGSTQEQQDARYSEAVRNLGGLNVEFMRKTSMDAVTLFLDGAFDFVYIDGNHLFDFAMMDIIRWVPKVRRGGIFAVHDYHTEVGADVITAVNAYAHCHHIDPWYVTRERLPSAFWVKS